MMNLLNRPGEFSHLLFKIIHKVYKISVVWTYVSFFADIWVAVALMSGKKSTRGMACAIVSILMGVLMGVSILMNPKR